MQKWKTWWSRLEIPAYLNHHIHKYYYYFVQAITFMYFYFGYYSLHIIFLKSFNLLSQVWMGYLIASLCHIGEQTQEANNSKCNRKTQCSYLLGTLYHRTQSTVSATCYRAKLWNIYLHIFNITLWLTGECVMYPSDWTKHPNNNGQTYTYSGMNTRPPHINNIPVQDFFNWLNDVTLQILSLSFLSK